MRLSDAMLAGSLITELQRCNINRCALGAALNAIGQSEVDDIRSRYSMVDREWPWTQEIFPEKIKLPVDDSTSSYEIPYYQGLIMFYFDFYVSQLKTMTFEGLVSLVRIMEPDCGECNRFICTCQPAEPEPAPDESAQLETQAQPEIQLEFNPLTPA